MGKRQEVFRKILATEADVRCVTEIRKPSLDDILRSGFYQEILRVYHKLGGCLETVPIGLGAWDLNVCGVAVELDENLHFNRYRGITLDSNLYSELEAFPLENYRKFCEIYENDCLKVGSYGGKWTNPSCERQFGTPSSSRTLFNGGAPRWKQRAFYDYIKDISPLVVGTKVARVSIWDEIVVDGNLVVVSKLLDSKIMSAAVSLHALVKKRSGNY